MSQLGAFSTVLTDTLRSAAEFPITDPKNQDAVNIRALCKAMLETAISARSENAPTTPAGFKLVRADVLEWLNGAAPHPDTGEWFERPEGAGAFWWRSKLRAATVGEENGEAR